MGRIFEMPGSDTAMQAIAGKLALACMLFFPTAMLAAEMVWQGRQVAEILEAARADGLNLVYSTRLVSPELTIDSEPLKQGSVARLDEILKPHGLTLNEVDGVYYVIRLEAPPADTTPVSSVQERVDEMDVELVELEGLTISASRYVLFSNSQFFIDQRAIQALPDLGEDPIRSAQRLPGAAASGLSSRSHFRGGEHNETAIYLNGLKLLDPFHIRDYHSIFSSIDARAISGVEAYTGGFPATYGDQMSGVLLLDTRQSEEPMHTEIGLSVYNTSLLNTGYTSEGRADWLLSARSSNLDLILNEDLGKPDYFDVFAELGVNLNDGHRLSFNALYSDDQVVVITESDPEELEKSVSDTQNEHFWISLENQWTPFLSSTSVLSHSSLKNRRNAEVNDPERLLGRISDNREATITGFSQHWSFDGFSSHRLRMGFDIRREEARYDYQSIAEYREFFEFWPGIENPVESNIQTAPGGNSYSLFLSDRWRFTQSTSLELGLRWDKQTYTEPEFDSQLNPRISLLHSFGTRTDFRLTWGRYSQSQAIHEMQVDDGIDHFFAPQKADHWIAGVQHRFQKNYRLRAEVFLKDYKRLKPRFENLFDPLALIPELSPDRVRLDPESALAKGLELTLEYRGDNHLDGWATYTWAKVTDSINGTSQRRSWDQRHAVQMGLAWRPGLWEIGVALSVHTGWPITGMTLGMFPAEDEEEEYEYFPIPGPRNGEQLGTFAQLDFRVSRDFPVRYGRLKAFFEVTNATNRKNECCIDYDIDEDEEGNVFLDRTVDDWLPIIPAIGLMWEF